MKLGTKYYEGERELSQKAHVLSNLGLNPFACRILVRSFLKNCDPKPVTLDYYIDVDGGGREHIQLELRRPGYLGTGKGDPNLLDEFAMRLFCRSYFMDVRPNPVSFLYAGIEVHLRTPGVSDQTLKNIAREIFNPKA